MNTTMKAVTREIDLSILQKKDARGVIQTICKVLAGRTESLRKFLDSSYGQMAKYMILWQYQDKGYSRYIYITEGENCDTCDSLDGQTFLISEACSGVNLAPMHPNCDCAAGILDANGNIVSIIGDESKDESDSLLAGENDKTNWYDALLRIPADAKKLFYNFLSAQTNRMENIKNPIDLIDWFMFGYLSANKNRGQVMLNDPSLYNIGNWASSGFLDTIKGTFNADEPLSLQHWLDSFGLATTVVSAYNLANSSAAGTSQINSSNNIKTGLDDSVDDVAKGAGSKIGKLDVIDGKVGGKVPVDDFNAIRSSSVKNPNADSITLGKYTNDSSSYIAKAGKDSSYFDMGSEWGAVQKKYGLTNNEMFEYFNKPAVNDAISSGKTIKFSHNPISLEDGGFLQMEWDYIKNTLNLTDNNLIKIGDFWYVK